MHERGLARSAHAGHAGDRVQRNVDVHVLQVVLGRALQPDLLSRPSPPRRRHGNRQLVAQVLRGQRPRLLQQAGHVAGIHDAAALLAGAEPDVDDVIGDANHVLVVLDDEDGVALVAKLLKDVDEPLVVARVQADRRLVQHVERADERRAERGRQIDALRFAARQRRRQPVERQVVEADVAQEREAPANLAQHLVGDRRLLLTELQLGEELLRVDARSAPTLRPPSGRRRARCAPRAAAARRRNPDTRDIRDSGSGTRARAPCISCARASGRSRGCPRNPLP